MSPRTDRARSAAFGGLLVGLLTVGALIAWQSWDQPVGPAASTAPDASVDPCHEVAPEGVARTDAFRLGGTVVRAERWCGTVEVVVEAEGVADVGRFVVVASTTQGSATLGPSDAARARLDVGPDGWVAIGLVQADPQVLANGGAWVTVTAGEPQP